MTNLFYLAGELSGNSSLKTLLDVLLFFTSVGEMTLIIYKISHKAPVRVIFSGCILFLIPSALLVGRKEVAIDTGLLCMGIFLLILHLITAFPREYHRREQDLTINAIREATDNVPLGVCFEDPDGRIVLCNDTMHRIWFAFTGTDLQTGRELEQVLTDRQNTEGMLPLGYVRLTDGQIYEFRMTAVAPGGNPGWRQFTAQNVTREYNINQQLQVESEKLRKVNRKLKKLYAGMADAIIEKETLEMKIYIHDTMGRSLITIKDIMKKDAQTEKKMETLQEISTLLSSRRTDTAETMEEVGKLAEKMGVTLEVCGYLPHEEKTVRLIAAAAKECITNCVKHAHGKNITIQIRPNTCMYMITITNDGDAPGDVITEGSGLRNLRSAVEAAGGEMYTSCSPTFALILNLPKMEGEDDD